MAIGLILGLSLGCGSNEEEEPPVEETTTGADTGDSGDTTTTGDTGAENSPPTVEITAPASGLTFAQGELIEFAASVEDAEDAPGTLTVLWSSSLQGTLSEDPVDDDGIARLTTGSLSGGSHTITLLVIDADGAQGDDAIDLVVNVPPGAPGVTIDPLVPRTDDALEASVTEDSTDRNRNATLLSYAFEWFESGEPTGITGKTVAASETAKGEIWEVRVTPDDGLVAGESGTALVVIQNTPPVCGEAVISPAAGTLSSDFTCACTDWSDADAGDVASDHCVFTIGLQNVESGDCQLLAADAPLYAGAEITCALTPSDGEDDGDPVTTAPAYIVNEPPPSPTDVTLTPDDATAASILTCAWTEVVDPDGDSLGYVVTWIADGYENPGLTAASVQASALSTAPGVPVTKGVEIVCEVQSNDGTSVSAPAASAPLVIENAPPVGGSVTVGPVGATEESVMTCDAKNAVDPDGDTVEWVYEWSVDGGILAWSESTLTGDYFDKGDTVDCAAVPGDGESLGEQVNSQVAVVIQNTLPTVDSVTLEPPSPLPGTIATCNYQGHFDPDPADPEQVGIQWIKVDQFGGASIEGAQGVTWTVQLIGGEQFLCRVTPYDDEGDGESVDSPVVTVGNTGPTLLDVEIGPDPAYADSELTCTPVGFSDPDGDPPVYQYVWTKNNLLVGGATSNTLSGGFAKGDDIRCIVTPGDGTTTGPPVPSDKLTISNSPPVALEVTISPTTGPACIPYECDVGAVADIDDGDPVLEAYRWEVNGFPAPGGTSTYSGPLNPGEQLQCFAQVTDGETEPPLAETASNIATIINLAPSLLAAAISPADPTVGDLLTCVPSGYEDLDCGSDPTYDFEWLLNGEVLAEETGFTLATTGLAPGAELQCRATPKDQWTTGAAATSSIVTL